MRYNSLSLLIHVIPLLLFLFLKGGDGNGEDGIKGQGAEESMSVDVIERPQPTKEIPKDEVVIIPMTDAELILQRQRDQFADENCPNHWYGGIGIQSDQFDDAGARIIKVYAGYAAELAGLQAGDIIVSKDTDYIIGDPGTSFNMVVRRGAEILNLHIVRVKVCY